jgi:glycosyltransferase involved in cell wall biosynthesis
LKILIIHRYYWPDKTPCSNILHQVSKYLDKNKHEIDILSSQPSYVPDKYLDKFPTSEVIDNVNIHRLLLLNETYSPFRRLINAIYLGIWTIIKSIVKKYDIIISTTVPPVLNGFFAALACNLTKAKFIYFCMDLNPEIGKVSKDFKNQILFKLLLRIDDWSCQKANLVLVHSQDMLKTLKLRPNGTKYNIKIMSNFSPQTLEKNKNNINLSTELKKKLTIIYTGNIGRFQGLVTVIDAMSLLVSRKDIELIIMGNGIEKKKLLEKAQRRNLNIKFYDYQSLELTKIMIRNADIGLVTLIPKIYKYAYPSKIMTYLEQGKPIICALEKESQIVKNMKNHGYGFHTQFGNKRSMANLFIRLADDKKWKKKMSQSALKAFKKNFSSNIILDKWKKVVNDL